MNAASKEYCYLIGLITVHLLRAVIRTVETLVTSVVPSTRVVPLPTDIEELEKATVVRLWNPLPRMVTVEDSRAALLVFRGFLQAIGQNAQNLRVSWRDQRSTTILDSV
jgi:hypothetical protein